MERNYVKQVQRLEDEFEGLQKEIRHKEMNITQIMNESSINMQPAPVLLEDRENEIANLERELKLLEGDYGEDGDDDELDPSHLDSSQTLSLSTSMTKQLTNTDTVAMSQSEMG